ncbi:MAG: hypothetical protein H0U67_16760 [Gemmatimonadetes bacterium]|nr:hypothetical protein [Gemmatimonadota bacterium]
MIPTGAFAELTAIQHGAFEHRVQFEEAVHLRQENGEYLTEWVTEPEERGRLLVGGQRVGEIAAAIGVQAHGILRVRSRVRSVTGKRAIVRGSLRGAPWQRLIEITADLGGNTERMVRRLLWVDVELT